MRRISTSAAAETNPRSVVVSGQSGVPRLTPLNLACHHKGRQGNGGEEDSKHLSQNRILKNSEKIIKN
jgi:hypothetical protein